MVEVPSSGHNGKLQASWFGWIFFPSRVPKLTQPRTTPMPGLSSSLGILHNNFPFTEILRGFQKYLIGQETSRRNFSLRRLTAWSYTLSLNGPRALWLGGWHGGILCAGHQFSCDLDTGVWPARDPSCCRYQKI